MDRKMLNSNEDAHPQEWRCALSMLTRALRPSLSPDSHAQIELPCLGIGWPPLPYHSGTTTLLETPPVAVWRPMGREGSAGQVQAQRGEPHVGFAWMEDLLMAELEQKSIEVCTAKKEREKLRRARDELEHRNAQLKRQLTLAAEMMAGLRQEVVEKERELDTKERQVCELSVFLRDTAVREADAKLRLQSFIEDLLERADTAESLLQDKHARYAHAGYNHAHTPTQYTPLHTPSHQQYYAQRYAHTPHCKSSGAGLNGTYQMSSNLSQAVCPFCGKPSPSAECVCVALRCVFGYLDVRSLLAVGAVCRSWRNVSRHSSLWTHITLKDAHISSMLLVSLSRWCCQTRSLTMRNLSAPRRYHETREEHYRRTRGCLEAGLEALLRATGRSLLELTVTECPNILTDRCVWLASCYCRSLHTLTYRSATDPVGQEVIWALGAGCRNISSLQVAPLQPCLQPSRFGNRCLQLIGRCWPQLSEVGVGGACCGVQGLLSLVRSCVSLRRLQLHGVCEMSVCVARQLCREGLRCLETLEFHATPVTPDALLHFHSMCGQLRCVLVQASIRDYFQDPDTEEAHRHFNQTINKMQALQSSILSGILHVNLDRC
ncbi:F-box only protein 41-like [Engraulis encrasicolus]|uniref:F-box only protein 41-like n=1 Tax=Engraulis encrasicolus TaxID=184585 RepID=UPI002FD52F46